MEEYNVMVGDDGIRRMIYDVFLHDRGAHLYIRINSHRRGTTTRPATVPLYPIIRRPFIGRYDALSSGKNLQRNARFHGTLGHGVERA